MVTYQYDIQTIKNQAKGHWLDILPAIVPALSGAVASVGAHVPCPVHYDSVDGFRLFHDAATDGMGVCNSCHHKPVDGFGLIMWATGYTMTEALKAVTEYLDIGLCSNVASVKRVTATTDKTYHETNKRPHKGIKYLLDTSSRTPTSAAKKYYINRGIPDAGNLVCKSIQYHKGASVYVKGKPLLKDGKPVKYPCIIGRASGATGWTDGIHQTFITPDGRNAYSEILKLAISAGFTEKNVGKKWMLGSLTGGAVRLGKSGKTLIICEGLETGLVISHARGTLSVACCGTAMLMTGVDIPPQVERVLIYADKDRNNAGLNAAEALKEKISIIGNTRRSVEILLPPSPVPIGSKSIDWLDDKNNLKKL